MPLTLQTTNGVVLDPFSIMVSGLLRQHGDVKTKYDKTPIMNAVHGEARFKQAFVNACHFAESMTVIGPVAQLQTDRQQTELRDSLTWLLEDSEGDNIQFFSTLKSFLRSNNLNNVPLANYLHPMGHLLHVLPDFSLKRDDNDWENSDQTSRGLFNHLFLEGWPQYSNQTYRMNMLRPNVIDPAITQREFHRGAPVLALMAVVFTFKKPTTPIPCGELTNLGSWPPVVFMLPVLVPAGATIDAQWGRAYVRRQVTNYQPTLMSYQLRLNWTNREDRTVPFGQPYKLTSVNQWGKEPDILRSLSDVFKALWSQAAQYCAWNFRFTWENQLDKDETKLPLRGELALDPIGAGRRIRGHNRFMGKYDAYLASMFWESTPPAYPSEDPAKPYGWRLGRHTDDRFGREVFQRQLRAYSTGVKEFIYVFPSYFQEGVQRTLLPTALTLARWMLTPHAGLEDFLDGQVISSVAPANCREEESTPGDNHCSFADRVAESLGATPLKHQGRLPIHKVPVNFGFDKEGEPTVFGLAIKREAERQMGSHTTDLPLVRSQTDELIDNTSVMSNFKFLDAFCSKTTKDLTEVFSTIKKKSVTDAKSGLINKDLIIDLFDSSDSDDGMLD